MTEVSWGTTTAPLVRHVESDNMVHPEFEAYVEQIHLTRVDEPSQVDCGPVQYA